MRWFTLTSTFLKPESLGLVLGGVGVMSPICHKNLSVMSICDLLFFHIEFELFFFQFSPQENSFSLHEMCPSYTEKQPNSEWDVRKIKESRTTTTIWNVYHLYLFSGELLQVVEWCTAAYFLKVLNQWVAPILTHEFSLLKQKTLCSSLLKCLSALKCLISWDSVKNGLC